MGDSIEHRLNFGLPAFPLLGFQGLLFTHFCMKEIELKQIGRFVSPNEFNHVLKLGLTV